MAAFWSLGGALRGMFQKATIDEGTWDDLETALLSADFGPDLTEQIVEELRRRAGELGRPKIELDYLDRLLKRF